MLSVLQLITIATMLAFGYLFLLAFGPPRRGLLYTAAEKVQWDGLVQSKLGSWFAVTNIVGTLTSLATVYVFFIGNSVIFGAWTFFCIVTIFAGSLITNLITKRVLSGTSLGSRLKHHSQVGAVLASVFFDSRRPGSPQVRLVKAVSLCTIAGVIWLEFALFADITGALVGWDGILPRALLLAACSGAVFYFTLRYGLRGFVFADLFQSPLILLASLITLGGVVLLASRAPSLTFTAITTPMVPLSTCILFAAHVTFLNLFLVVVTEPHWLRLWIFRDRETNLQVRALAATGILWALLIAIGLLGRTIVDAPPGAQFIVKLMNLLAAVSPVFLVAFWVGGVAALFSTADSQVYSALLVNSYDTQQDRVLDTALADIQPAKVALVASLGITVIYASVRWLALPFEKLVFLIVPLSLNVLPGLVALARGLRPSAGLMVVSVVLYAACGAIGFLRPEDELRWTLAAALVPAALSVIPLCGFGIRAEKVEDAS